MIPNDFSVVRTGPVLRDTVEVGRGELLRIHNGRGTEVHVHQGTVWVTQSGDRKDRFLQAGERFQLDRDGRAIAQAFSDAIVTLISPAQNLDITFSVVRVPSPPAPVVPAAPGQHESLPADAGADTLSEVAAGMKSAVWDAFSRGWFLLTRLTSAKPAASGGRHG